MKSSTLFYVVFLIIILLAGCRRDEIYDSNPQGPDQLSGEAAREWNDFLCLVVKETPGFFPTQAARVFGYSGITLYESIIQGWTGAPRLAGQIQGLRAEDMPKADIILNEYHWGISANAAMAEITRRLFGNNLSSINTAKLNDLEDKWRSIYARSTLNSVLTRSENFGKAVAVAIFDYSRNDGGHLAYLDPFELAQPYSWPVIPGAWEPTGSQLNPLSPRWDQNRSFLRQNIIQECQPIGHPAFSTNTNSEFYKAALHVYETVTNHTKEQKVIAEYWADDPFATCTPAGHTFNIMTQLLEEHDASLAMSALGYAKLGIAESDVFIACWKSKYDYFLIRPVTYIKRYIDPSFNTLIGTPPFPAYTSGHASEAAAGSRIFTNMFTRGDGNYPFTDRSQLRYGFNVRSFNNFNEMALECANSRLFGGIHYDFDNQMGLAIGRAIGDAVNTQIRWPRSQWGR
jgi:hypothetical protein